MKSDDENYLNPKKLRMRSWYRGRPCNFIPKDIEKEPSVAWIRKNMLKGLTPKKPFITKDHYITTIGSCFAGYIKRHLRDNGFRVDPNDAIITRFGAGSVNVYTLLQQFKWAYDLEKYDDELWIPGKDVVANHGDVSKKRALYVFNKTQVLILTLGLSEVWYNKKTGGVFWRAVPKDLFDKKVHAFRYLTHAETKEKLHEIVSVVRKCIGDIPIIFTVSPVRMFATFRPIPTLVANDSSKATLRSSVNEVVDETDGNVFYWPSYDIVNIHADAYQDDGIHIRLDIIKKIMKCFFMEYTVGWKK